MRLLGKRGPFTTATVVALGCALAVSACGQAAESEAADTSGDAAAGIAQQGESSSQQKTAVERSTPKPATSTQPAPDRPAKQAKRNQAAAPTSKPTASTPPAKRARRSSTAVAAWEKRLAQLPIRVRATGDGYDRKLFGWRALDFDRNGCDQRNDILRRDLHNVSIKAGTNGCKVTAGSLHDPYDGKTVTKPLIEIEIDHVVALYDGYLKGAKTWDERKRQEFANDPLNLLATQRHLNREKGASDAAKWLPPHAVFQCAYVGRQIDVKTKYGLWVTAPERDAMARVLAECSAPAVTRPVDPPKLTADPPPAPTPTSEPTATATVPVRIQPTATATVPQPVYYKNCAAVRDAGKAPLYRGQPGYSTKLDRDRDGVACE